jgi:hypothetical protein
MTIRVVLAMTWTAMTGLAGGWLVLSPWALGEQTSTGSWTVVTSAQVRTGLGLLALAVLGLGLVIAEGVSALRKAGALRRRTPVPQAGERQSGFRDQPAVPLPEDLDRAMIALANALATELGRDRPAGDAERARSLDTRREG